MNNLPEILQAGGVAVAAILTAWQARTAVKVKALQDEVDELKREQDLLRNKFRTAINHIREWMTWWRKNHPGTEPPPIPPALKDEV